MRLFDDHLFSRPSLVDPDRCVLGEWLDAGERFGGMAR